MYNFALSIRLYRLQEVVSKILLKVRKMVLPLLRCISNY